MDTILNWTAVVNEAFLFVGGLSLLPMTNLVREEQYRWSIGYIFIGIVSAFILYNFIVLSIMAVRFTKVYLREKRLAK